MISFDGSMFGRRLRLQIGDVVFDAKHAELGLDPLLGDPDALRVSFKVRKEIPKKTASTAGAQSPGLDLAVYNLAERTRRKLDQLVETKNRGVSLEAGYSDDIGTIFFGEVTKIYSAFEGTEWVTRVIGKGGHLAGQTIINETVAPGATKADRVQKLIEVLSRENPAVSFKRAKDRISQNDYKGAFDELVNGVTMTGRAMDHFRVLSKDLGMESWIDDGEAVVLGRDEVRGDRRVVLSPSTGLIAAPSRIFDDKDPKKLIIRARSLLQWRLGLGGVVELVSASLEGFFRVRSLVHTGDTHGDEYSTEVEAEEVARAFDPLSKEELRREAGVVSEPPPP